MKVKNHLIPLFENGTKTIELRKVSKLQELLNHKVKGNNIEEDLSFIDNKGRFKIDLYAANPEFINRYNPQFIANVGTITINGYSIIKNPFVDITENITKGVKGLTDKFYQDKIVQNNFSRENWEWIQDNWDWLKEFFKYEPEILVLRIEKFEKVSD